VQIRTAWRPYAERGSVSEAAKTGFKPFDYTK
jgi:hypothetical protein